MTADLVIRDFRPRDLPAVIALNVDATNPGVFDRADNLPPSLRHYPELLHRAERVPALRRIPRRHGRG